MRPKKQSNHNYSLTFYKNKPFAETPEKLCIMYNYGQVSKKRYSPVEIPQKIFNKKTQSIRKEYQASYSVAHDWIEKFNDKRNDVEVDCHNGTIDFEQGFRILKNQDTTELVRDSYPNYARDKGVKPSVIEKTVEYLTMFESKCKIQKVDYQDLKYDHLKRPTDIDKIQTFIDKLDILNSSKKKYMNYLNKITTVAPYFNREQRNPFNRRYDHGGKAQKKAIEAKKIKEGIGTIENNPYKLEALLWWLLSFCLRGVDCADILVMNINKIEGDKKGDLRDYFPQMSKDNNEKFYYVGNRTKMVERQNKKVKPLKILLNIYPVLLIHKMLRRIVRHIHPDIAYYGNDPLKIYNLNWANKEHKKKWANRLGTMSENTSKMFGATMKQTRHTFATNLAQILNVSYNSAEKQMSTALGHTNEHTQKVYINPDQIRQDLLQIEVIERFDVRKIVTNIIKTCSCYTFKVNSKEVKLVEKKNLAIKHLEIPATIWNWQKELEYTYEKLKSYSDIDVVIVDGKPVNKEIYRPTDRFLELSKERDQRGFETFVDDRKKMQKGFSKLHKKLSKIEV